MPVATAEDVAFQLADVTAWLAAWKGAEAEVLPEARARCMTILSDAWQFLFGDEKVPKQKALAPTMLAEQVRSLRRVLEKWEGYDETERKANLRTARNILASAIAFFA